MYVAKGTTPSFLKGLENVYQVPLLFLFVLVILANYWKMVVLAKSIKHSLITLTNWNIKLTVLPCPQENCSLIRPLLTSTYVPVVYLMKKIPFPTTSLQKTDQILPIFQGVSPWELSDLSLCL